MLDEIQKLGLSISDEQAGQLEEKLGDYWPSFLELVRSSSEIDAQEKLSEFRVKMKSLSIRKLVAVHSLLTEEQKNLLSDLL